MAKKVLIVDDSRTARLLVRMALEEGGYTLVEAVDGDDGVKAMEREGDVAIALCDVNMPKMDGMAMLKKLAPIYGDRTKFLMLTTEADPELVDEAKAHGALGWIVKPFKPALLLATVRKLVGEA